MRTSITLILERKRPFQNTIYFQEDMTMLLNKDYKFWFCTGSQDLYGDECLAKVAQHSKQIVDELNKTGLLPYEIVWKPTLITNALIRQTFNEANKFETRK